MRLIFYKKPDKDGNESTHFVNIDRINHFTVSGKDNDMILYAITSNDVHVLSERRKIENVNMLMSKIMGISDRSYVDIMKTIDDCNVDARKVTKGR